METLNVGLTWLAMHGYWFVFAGLVASFCVRDHRKRRTFVRVLLVFGGIILGSIFLAAAYGKFKPLPGFAWSWRSVRTSMLLFSMQVESYQILSPAASSLLAHVLPFFELFLGLWLFSSIWLRFSSLLASLVFVGFMAAIAYAYHRGLHIECSCGVGPNEDVGPGALLRDGLKFLLPSLIVMFGSFWVRREPGSAPTPQPATATPAQAPQ
jgi:Methylamine utilisation protein MauE